MTCDRCKHLGIHRRIDSPADLKTAILLAKHGIRDDIIEEIPDEIGVPFSRVSPHGCWDDIVAHGFRCKTCSQHFVLSADTFHGNGEWRPE